MRALIASLVAGTLVGALAATSGADTRIAVGTGERLIVVVGGEAGTRDDALATADAMPFGDVQGFYVAASGDFDGEEPGRWLLVSAFRTDAGALEFESLARAVGITGLRRIVTTYRGTDPIGLGQEPDPSGTGPLIAPLPAGHPARIG